jgi:hypothetical protein
MATGSLLNLTDAVITGRVKNGFALIRPPGHHAEPGTFYLFSSLNLRCGDGILYLQQCRSCCEVDFAEVSEANEEDPYN